MNITEYIRNRRFILPEWDRESLESSLAWKLYYLEVKQRILPPLLKYQTTLIVIHGIQKFLTSTKIISSPTYQRLHQHPSLRAMAISQREPDDPFQVGVEVMIATLWANLIPLFAHSIVEQIGIFYDYYFRTHILARSRQIPRTTEQREEDEIQLMNTSCDQIFIHIRRWFYSAIGAGIGSFFLLPTIGWGTLIGMTIADEWALRLPPPRRLFLSLLYGEYGDDDDSRGRDGYHPHHGQKGTGSGGPGGGIWWRPQ